MGDIYTNPPQSRNEAILRATIDGTEYEAPPQSRMEDLLVELKAAIEQGACTGSYNDLNNKPQINGVTLQGDQSISDLFDGKVDIGVGTVEESGYAELKDENGDRIFRASSANGGASVESGALIGQSGALVLYNGEGGLGSISPKGGARLVDVDLPAENGTLALDSQIASSQTPAKAAVVTVNDAAPINAEDITVDITPIQDLHGYDRPWAGGGWKNKLPLVLADIKALNTSGTWSGNVYTENSVKYTVLLDNDGNVICVNIDGVAPTATGMILATNQTFDTDCLLSKGNSSGSGAVSLALLNNAGTGVAVEATSIGATVEAGNYGNARIRVNANITVSNVNIYPMIRLATETDSTFAPYSNICPIEGYTGAELDRDGNDVWTGNDTYTSASAGYVIPSTTISLPIGTYVFEFDCSNSNRLMQFEVFKNNSQQGANRIYNSDGFNVSTHNRVKFTINEAGTNLRLYSNNESGASISNVRLYSTVDTYTASFGEVVYGGKWHVTAGGTDKTHANIASYNGETINEPWLSSLDEYVAGATPTTGAQVVYPLTTPTTISTPKQNVPMLKGVNTVSADCGDTQLKYQPDNVVGELKGEIQELESELDKLDKAYMASDTFSERGIDGEYQITRIGNEIHIAVVIDDASIATQTGSVDLIADLPDEFKCNPSYGAVLGLRHSSGTGKIEFKINPGITRQSFYMYVEEVNTTSGVWFPIYDVPGKAL